MGENKQSASGFSTRVANLAARAKKRPAVVGGVALGVVALLLGSVAFVRHARGGGLFAPPTASELAKEAKDEPTNAQARVQLGDALFAAGKTAQGIKAYDRALTIDPSAVTDTMVENLVDCFGHADQGEAASVITRHKLTQATQATQTGSKSSRGARATSCAGRRCRRWSGSARRRGRTSSRRGFTTWTRRSATCASARSRSSVTRTTSAR